MTTFKLLILILILAISGNAAAQNGNSKKKLRDDLNNAMKQKLVTNLVVSEEVADKIMNSFKENSSNMKALMKERKEIMSTIEKNPDASDVEAQLDKMINIDSRMTETRNNFYTGLKSFLTPQQVAKALILRMNFKKELKNQIGKHKNKNKSNDMNEFKNEN